MSLSLPKYVLFDMDGTLIDNYQVHLDVWSQINAKYGGPTDKETIIRLLHGTNHEVCVNFFGTITREESDRIGDEKEALYRSYYRPIIKPVNGLFEMLDFLKSQSIKMAVGTMGNRANAEFVVNALKLDNYFDVVATAEDVVHGKPNPAIFLHCLKMMKVDQWNKEELWIFEDTSSGVKAAVNANGTALGICTSKTNEELESHGAVITAKDFSQMLTLVR
jgi:HAD superfamily hydrolase (TIGR01509 family)